MTTQSHGRVDRHGEVDISGRQFRAPRKSRTTRRGLIAVVVGAVSVFTLPIAATITAQPAAAAGGCKTKLELIKGNPVGVSCGPASAKLHYKGKTYSFKSGTCFISKLPAGRDFGLALGKNSDDSGNAGLVGMSLDFGANGLSDAVVKSNQGGVYIDDAGGTPSKFGRTGTIKGTSNGVPYTVSWNCGASPSKD